MRKYALPILSLYLDYIVVSTAVALAVIALGAIWRDMVAPDMRWLVETVVSIALALVLSAFDLFVGNVLLARARSLVASVTRWWLLSLRH